VSDLPGPLPFTEVARELGIHLVLGTYRRGSTRPVVHNAAVVIGEGGTLLGTYHKTHSLRRRAGRPRRLGDARRRRARRRDTPLARIGVIICFDGDYPELARITAIRGRRSCAGPSALLRSADLWELTNRARAYDNHVYVIGSNATGVDPAGTIYFGNSMIVTPIAEVVARAASHECWISARLDPDSALSSLTPGSSVPQPFDHLADRNLAVIRRHADALLARRGHPSRAPVVTPTWSIDRPGDGAHREAA
jgi:predicted amidohydrolase